MPFKKRDVESALEQKGFKRIETDHSYFIYFTQTNKKSRVRTKRISHRRVERSIVSSLLKTCLLSQTLMADI